MFIPRMLERDGLAGYEPVALACYLAALDFSGTGAVYDVGANIGVYGLLARALTDRDVRAFEPAPDLAAVARRVGESNALSYIVEERALGADNGTATLFLSDVADCSNSLNPNFRPHTRSLDVPLETLDSYVKRTGARPAVVKVDTETTEPDVLKGAAETIERWRPWIFCEVLKGRTEDALAEIVRPWGYTWYYLDSIDPRDPQTEIFGDAAHQHLMWLFAPEPVGADYWAAVRAWRLALAACLAAAEPMTPARG
jgi:FkbM family methyltransferase